jgi:hypothetical protein
VSTIFISHSHSDRELARRIAAELRMAGIEVWIDEGEVKPGDSLVERLRAGVGSTEHFGIIVSPDSMASEWVQLELNAALEQGLDRKPLRIIPLLHRDCAVPECLVSRVQIDFRDPRRFHFAAAELMQTIAGGSPPLWLTAKEAARLIRSKKNPRGVLMTLSQQGVAQQYIQRSAYNDWFFADAKTGRSRVWIADFLDVSDNEVYPFGIRDGNITAYPHATLQQEMPLLDFNFLDSDIAVPRAIEAAIADGGVPADRDAFFVTTKLYYWRTKSTWIWAVSFLDVTLRNATCGVSVDARSGEVIWNERSPHS